MVVTLCCKGQLIIPSALREVLSLDDMERAIAMAVQLEDP